MNYIKKLGKHLTAIFTALIVTLCSIYSSMESVSAAGMTVTNTNVVYYAYNSNGAYSYSYTLSALPTANSTSTRGVIGTEDRYADYSKTGVVKIICEDGTFGTGFVVDDHTIATAAHCICDYKTNSAKNLYRIIIMNENGEIKEEIKSYNSVHVPKEYIDCENRLANVIHTNDYDYALIEVSTTLTQYNTFNLGTMMNSTNINVSSTGFPAYLFDADYNDPKNALTYLVNDFLTHNKMTGSGKITSYSSSSFTCDADLSSGNSGGPVYTTKTYNGNTYDTVIGIVIQGHMDKNNSTGKYEAKPTTCIRLSSDILHFFKNNPQIP